MIKYSIYLAMLLLVVSCNNKASEPESQIQTSNSATMQQQEKESIKALLSEYQKALNTSDAKLAQSLYTEDGIFMPTEAPSAVGSENILKSYEYVFSQIQLNIDFVIEEIEVENDFAFATTSSAGKTLIHATGDTVPEANRELFVFAKVDDDWKIARYMFNKTSPQQK